MAQSVYFNGETLTIPGAYSKIDVSGMAVKGDDGAKTIAIIGECTGGEPGAVQFFSSPSAARKVLKSGELLKACEKAWNPVSRSKSGVDIGGANIIACIRTNKATKSSMTIEKGTAPQIKFQSKDWGKETDYQVKMTDGTLFGTKCVTVYNPNTGVYENFNNLGNVFCISYSGPESYCKLTIEKDMEGVKHFIVKKGASKETSIEDINLPLDVKRFRSIKALIEEIRTYENYNVSTENAYNSKLKVTDLDIVEEAELKQTGNGMSPAFHRVTAIYADIALKLAANSNLIEVAEFNPESGAISNFEYKTMYGGDNGTSPASWLEYFDAISNFDITYIVPLTAEPIIHAELAAHVQELSGNLGKERRGIVGGNNGEGIKEAIARARDLQSDRMQVVHGGFYETNAYGEMELFPPYILAAQHAGRAAYLEDGEPATHDVYRMSAPEYKLEREEIQELIAGGVLAFEFVIGKQNLGNSFVRLVHDLTTDTVNEDTVHTERATGALADAINKELREELDKLLTGKRTSLSDLTSAKNRVLTVLADRQRKGHIIDYKDVYVSKTDTVTEVEYSVAPAEPNNFTLITGHFYSETIYAD